MALCAVNYPTLRRDDYEWIQSIRREHDRLFFDVVAPHISLVFPTDKIDEAKLTEHVAQIASHTNPFDIVIRCAILGDPGFMDHAHAFLIPDEGFSSVVRLHDALYTGPLRSELRLDLPFIPHVGVASTPGIDDCKALVDRINATGPEIRGRVETIDIVGYDGKTTWAVTQCALEGREA